MCRSWANVGGLLAAEMPHKDGASNQHAELKSFDEDQRIHRSSRSVT